MSRSPIVVDSNPFWVLLAFSLLGLSGGALLVIVAWVAFQTWWL